MWSFWIDLLKVVDRVVEVYSLEPFWAEVVLAEDEKFTALGVLTRAYQRVVLEVSESLVFDSFREEGESWNHQVVVVEDSFFDIAMELTDSDFGAQRNIAWNR